MRHMAQGKAWTNFLIYFSLNGGFFSSGGLVIELILQIYVHFAVFWDSC